MVSKEVDFISTLKAMHEEFGVVPSAPTPQDGNWGFNLGNPFGLLEASIPLDRKILESLGEPALALWHHLTQKITTYVIKTGGSALRRSALIGASGAG